MKRLYNASYVGIIWSIICITLSDCNNGTISYDPGELLTKIFNVNGSPQGRSRNGFITNDDSSGGFNNIYTDQIQTLIYQTSGGDSQYAFQHNADNGYKLIYVDDNFVKKDQKKRRRKPKSQRQQGFGMEFSGPYGQTVLQSEVRDPYLGPNPGLYRPSGPSIPSFASEALSTVTEALTSIALYDNYQCVPRLLCEAASGRALGSSQTLQSITGLQPLLALLSAYSGISSNPLFVFGRAAFLGMSSEKNPAACRYAYPLCPTDPEKLVYYLNNHNGGFFRFFNAPHQQNFGQIYNELSQNYLNNQQNIPIHNNNGFNSLYQNDQQQNLQQNYGIKFPYRQKSKYGLLNNIRFENYGGSYQIEKRIQNRPEKYLDYDEDTNLDNDNYQPVKWSFPETHDNSIAVDKYRTGKGLIFPENTFQNAANNYKRDPRGFVFPDSQTVRYTNFKQPVHFSTTTKYYNNFNTEYYKDYGVDKPNVYEDSISTVYVVRGNGDPRHPEVIKLSPGQRVQ